MTDESIRKKFIQTNIQFIGFRGRECLYQIIRNYHVYVKNKKKITKNSILKKIKF